VRSLFALALIALAAHASAQGSASFVTSGIEAPLAGPGDAARGRALLVARDPANCILCHAVEAAGIRAAGNLAPALDGIGARLTPAQLRARIVDSSRINPQTIMPSYFRTEGLVEVAAPYRGKTILAAQQVEDLVMYLSTLRQ
jgi:sulfur-oxidizing protein SoxX